MALEWTTTWTRAGRAATLGFERCTSNRWRCSICDFESDGILLVYLGSSTEGIACAGLNAEERFLSSFLQREPFRDLLDWMRCGMHAAMHPFAWEARTCFVTCIARGNTCGSTPYQR